MGTQVKMWTIEIDFGVSKFYNKVKVLQDKTYASLRVRLEEKEGLDFAFDFWDNDERCRIRPNIEALNDVLADVYILLVRDDVGEAAKRRRLDDDTVRGPATVEEGGHFVVADEGGRLETAGPVGSSRVTGTSVVTDSLDHQLNSTLLGNDIWERYLEQSERMKRDLKCSS